MSVYPTDIAIYSRAMYKVVWLLKRKPGLTHEQFREMFEASHAKLAEKYVGHLFVEYRRNYVKDAMWGGNPRQEGSGFGQREWSYDLISEWIMADEAAFQEVRRIMAQPEIDREFETDEERLIDRSSVVMIHCDVADSGAPPR